MLLNDDIEKPDGICLLTFFVDEFSKSLQKSFFSYTFLCDSSLFFVLKE